MARRGTEIIVLPGRLERLLRRLIPLCLLIFAANGFRFALAGAPGVAEVAHLRALALDLPELVGWIAGQPVEALAPAPVRSAPLPLIVDWLLWRMNPFGVAGLRFAHLALALAGFGLLLRAVAMRIDPRAAVLAGVTIALSPRIVEGVTRLGPAPFVVILFCAQLAILLTRGRIGARAPLTLFVLLVATLGLCGVPGMIAASVPCALLLLTAPDRPEAGRRLAAMALAFPAWVGPVLIELQAGAVADPLSLRGLATFAIRIAAHSAALLMPAGAALLVGGMAGLILLGLVHQVGRFWRNGPPERTQPFVQLLAALILGLTLTILAGPVLRRYDWTEPAAQTWLGLIVCLLAAACFTPRLLSSRPWPRRVRGFAASITVAGALAGAVSYHLRADWFQAGPEAALAQALEAAGGNRALVYTGANWGRAYFPHSWADPHDADQWLLSFDGRQIHRIRPGGLVGEAQPLTALDDYGVLLLARVERRGWRDLRRVPASGVVGASPPAPLAGFAGGWQAEPARAAPGEFWLTTQLLVRETGTQILGE